MSDLISRADAIDALCSVCGNDCDKTEFVYDAPQWDQVIMCPEHYVLTTLPSAQPEREKGKWIPCDVDIRGMTNMFVCSKCSSFTSLPILKYANAMEYDFCPNCGADMRGEQDG